MSTMAMVPCGGADADWCHMLEDINLLLSSSSSSPHAMASRADNCLPIAAALPGHGGHRSCRENQVLRASSGGAFAVDDCLSSSSSSALMNLQREDDNSFYLPMYSAPPPAVGDQYGPDQLPPLPAADAAMTSLDEALLLPFSDIDLEAFDNAEEHKPPVDQMIMTIPPAVQHPAAAGTRTPIIGGTTVGQNAGALVHAHQKAMTTIEDSSCFRRGASGVDDMAVVVHHGERRQAGSAAVALVPQPPPSLPRPRARTSGGGDRTSSAPAGKTRLDHIGFDDLRKYFYMPITRAAREMSVGLTVLKKRCRELGVARWPHRKMKSLKSLMANVQEMGNGMSPVAVQQELAALETYCALMEENPWIELTDRTKRLRQACFKESYKRRKAAAVNVMETDHIVYSFSQHHRHHHHQQLLPPPTSSSADGRHGQSSRFFRY